MLRNYRLPDPPSDLWERIVSKAKVLKLNKARVVSPSARESDADGKGASRAGCLKCGKDHCPSDPKPHFVPKKYLNGPGY